MHCSCHPAVQTDHWIQHYAVRSRAATGMAAALLVTIKSARQRCRDTVYSTVRLRVPNLPRQHTRTRRGRGVCECEAPVYDEVWNDCDWIALLSDDWMKISLRTGLRTFSHAWLQLISMLNLESTHLANESAACQPGFDNTFIDTVGGDSCGSESLPGIRGIDHTTR